jgi:hypothetical protein
MSTTMATVAGGSSTVSVPQPATTLEPPGGPFIRYSQEGSRPQYAVSTQAWGAQITNPLVAVPGYVSRFRVTIANSAGTNGSTTVATTSDAPYNCVQLVQLMDANNNPIIIGPGYEILYLVPLFSGGFGLLGAANIANLPSYSAPSVGSTGTGAFSFATALPLELSKGYGLLGMANSGVLPSLTWNLATSATTFSTAPATLGTLSVTVVSDYYWLPQGVNIAPPGLGTSRQWIVTKGNPTVASASYTNVQFPRPGGYLDTIILVLRDSTGARIDQYPSNLSIWVDGVAMVNNRPINNIYDDMYNQFGGITRPTGVLAFTRKNSLSQLNLGLLDTGEQYLSTNPGTLIEVGGTWGTISNAPATLEVITGQVVASEALLQGLPEA